MAKCWLEVPILNDEHVVVVCWGTADEVLKVMHRYGYPKDEPYAAEVNKLGPVMVGMCFYCDHRPPVIGLPVVPVSPARIGTLAHGAVHAVTDILGKVGAAKDDSDEVLAHSVGAVVRHTLAYVQRTGGV
jgi:hypothetical protein